MRAFVEFLSWNSIAVFITSLYIHSQLRIHQQSAMDFGKGGLFVEEARAPSVLIKSFIHEMF